MKSVRTPNYVVTEVVQVGNGPHDERTLQPGSFVRPIETPYIPKHVLEKYPHFNQEFEVFVYCRYGIIPVRKTYVRET